MKSFSTAVKEVLEDEEEEGRVEFELDGEPLVAYKPSEAQFAILMQAVSRYQSKTEAMAGAIDFFHAILDEPSAQHVHHRLLDRKDAFGLEEVEEIVMWLVEEWTGRPMKRRSDSTRSPKSTGPASSRGSRARAS